VKVLVDTCVLLWLITGERKLSPRVSASLMGGEVWLSSVSVWEIAVKFSKGSLRLPLPPDRLIPAARDRYGISPLAIDEESALHIIKLPPLHSDPFDRMLVSQAIIHGMTIVTPDPLVTQYPARTMW
jgi:PIN domain nuclease of toxin-antitoxin system